MFGWLKAWQIGAYVLSKLQEILTGGATSFDFDVSYKGQRYTVHVDVSKVTTASSKSF